MGADGCRYPHKPAIGVKSSSTGGNTRDEQRSISLLNRPVLKTRSPRCLISQHRRKFAKSDQNSGSVLFLFYILNIPCCS